MTAQEKAKELFRRFTSPTLLWDGEDWFPQPTEAKKCALICVDEIYSAKSNMLQKLHGLIPHDDWQKLKLEIVKEKAEVKQEIEIL